MRTLVSLLCLTVGASVAAQPIEAARTWTELDVSGPSARLAPVAYDWGERLVVLSGGMEDRNWLNDVWLWDGTSWEPGTPSPPAKPPRTFSTIDYTPARHGSVELFGVNTWPSGAKAQREVWTYEADVTGGIHIWSLAPRPKQCDAERHSHAAAYHAGRGELVVHGGRDELDILGDTWVLRDYETNWWHYLGASPSARWDSTATYDSARERVILFGGRFDGGTWAWDGSWTQLTGPEPSARWSSGLAYDYVKRVVVMFSGMTGAGEYPRDTWELDATGWRLVPTADAPSARARAGMVGTHEGVFLFGGAVWPGIRFDDTWIYR